MVEWLLAVFVTVGLLAPASSVKGASVTRKIVIAPAAMNARVGPLWIARGQGLFAKYGVDADSIFVRGAPTLAAGIAGLKFRRNSKGGFYVNRDRRYGQDGS
jgi:hypothetical protein